MKRLLTGAVASVLLASGCATLPSSGDVHRASDVVEQSDLITYQPAPPAPGADPEEIVSGFLDAMLAYPVSSATANAYLTTEAADDWAAGDGVTIYRTSDMVMGPVGGSGTTADLTLQQTGVLDRTGHFQASAGPVTHRLELVQEKGEWRIANPPGGLAITRGYFESYYRTYDVYAFDMAGEELIADPVHLQVGDRLATSLMSALVAGVEPRVAGETRTYVPPAPQWSPAVTLDGSRATVEFEVSLTTLDVEVRRRLSAQIVRTLAQVPGVESVRIVGTDGPLVAGGVADQPITAWARFDAAPPIGRAGAVVADQLVTLALGSATPTELGTDGDPDAVLVAVGAGVWAAVAPDGTVRSTNGAGTRFDSSVAPIGLAWDNAGRLWVADRPGGRLRVRVLAENATVQVEVPDELASATSFALDPSGGRYAVTLATGQARVGVVSEADDVAAPRLEASSQVAPDVANPGQVVWLDLTRLAVVGDGETGRQVYRAHIDGSPSDASAGTAPRLPNVTITAVAAGQGDDPDLYVTDSRERLWYLPAGGSWRLMGVVGTGLTSGR